MSEEKKNGFNSIIKEDAERKRAKKKLHREITFREYLALVAEDPAIAQLSASRLWEIIQNAEVVQLPEEEQWMGVSTGYNLFRKELYGVDKPISEAVEHIKVGATRGSTGKYLLILVGPPGAGKSTWVRILGKALENYNKRPVFFIKGCPKHEEPLHLLPRYMRDQAATKKEHCTECKADPDPKHLHIGVQIEGDLCPVCRDLLETKYSDPDGTVRWHEVPVETFTFSIQGRRGIGSFEPSNEITSDTTALSGRENIGITSNPAYGHNHPRAFEIGGEIPAGERGFVEGREVTSSDPKVLRVFFSVAEEKQLKIEGSYFPHLSVDTVIIGHTNLTAFKEFATNKKYEGLHDRFIVVPFHYPLRIRDEVRLYKKLIERESDFVRLKGHHIAPGALELAALFAILTRLTPSQMGIDSLTKAKVYNGDRALTELRDKDKKPIDIRELIEEGRTSPDIAKIEGMFGVSSRTVLAALNSALAKESDTDNGCLTPLKTLTALREIFEHRMGVTPEEVSRYKELLSSSEGGTVVAEYKEFTVSAVEKAFLKSHDDLARQMFDDYVREARFYREQKRKFVRGRTDVVRDTLTGRPKTPNVKFLREIEEFIPISESEADNFRGEILEAGSLAYDSYPPLSRAVDKKLLSDSKDMLKTVLAIHKPKDEESKKRASDLFSELTGPGGFCKTCAKEIIEKADEFLNE
ncbi:MAG: hypothetical protein A2915_00270 [Candidatus Yanofskybacteria bacterium RIFCSPLOWO2_01_FULL_41_34]|uniref:PrkA AAA domain-containing protein n=1 Tax=Candidatus Yanofskybacteria bacterium RIFCSPHIGHO2_01_FULL_41_26 TaxID=1802661 RepID=A0A1F8EEB5_9BACT|nr:MAG: hypothetical protein A2649_02200 [Candidatus Yanofskybacteria bacterium RIFCSPHIGHO2_01_FULL_41_26]OGN21257.1 MAG: hypothetical protein A2915_00270 [Candidatus Yanofskybacteria bacterium RIFCSPLOWO2_01_FULL_41_34]